MEFCMDVRQESSHLVRVILYGDEASEKSKILSCINRHRNVNDFSSPYHQDRIQYPMQYREDCSVKLDLINHKQERTDSSNPLRGIQIVILVFSYKDLLSLDNLTNWAKEVDRYSKDNIPKIVIGNCFSHNESLVPENEVIKVIEELGLTLARVIDDDIESIKSALTLSLDQLPSLQHKTNSKVTQHQLDHDDEQHHRFKCTML